MNNESQLHEEETPIYYNNTVSTMKDIEEAYKEYLRNKEYE